MVVCLFLGLRTAEASVVLPGYYGMMTLFSAVQGLLLFDLVRKFRGPTAAGFIAGVLLCLVSLALVVVARRRAERRRLAESADGAIVDPAALLVVSGVTASSSVQAE